MKTKKTYCPTCNAEIINKEWYDKHGKVEEYEGCDKCQYTYHWAHGRLLAYNEGEIA